MSRFIRYLVCVFLPLSLVVNALAADDMALTVKANAPQTYTVVKGDTLWDISALYLDNPWLWPRLWQINPEIDNPHLIYPGDKLTLVWRNGQPVLSLKPMVKLSPKVRVLEKKAVPTVQEGLVLPYLHTDRLLDKQTLQESQRVLGASDGKQYLTTQDTLYISGQQTHPKWGIYREIAEFSRHDAAAKNKTMVALRLIATGELVSADEAFSGLTITAQQQEIRVNDIALPEVGVETLTLSTTFFPSPSRLQAETHILGSLEGSEYSAQNQVVVIDKGLADQLRQGTMFDLIQAGSKVSGKKGQHQQNLDETLQLPSSLVGSLMVIRPYEHFSLALITDSRVPIGKSVIAVSPLKPELTIEPNEQADTDSVVKDDTAS
ncbi:LysM peptidoglycan-binding domain-containing protein [Vibrio anguillarum]|uniref:LysM peptidoglycan-binding domain-containing protein n=1 Tax=Vibrio anguillarum TaxID=55601 RepID=UPI000B5449B6|nr:LysM peptidoglycan-binding domain-containing protein [Vibrio anguillarum]ASF98705.1 peptidoglycan-binding protein [Vibrio anguillarum]MBF4257048.1 LysM peptidoglycan-binding domain-containing protein [Vibrio anguillarum]MBF4276115.1 LysM peptidoglycan-binding domain-containing protein [Vibrio anguillarum]MBF4299722.1 LysM peptidoglycan-binding domain-containing protein [Vibrio anguillarum]MBF4364013.1 LysM peptidoglycan-binding domain-containing protein [Vibrio anguillarum]